MYNKKKLCANFKSIILLKNSHEIAAHCDDETVKFAAFTLKNKSCPVDIYFSVSRRFRTRTNHQQEEDNIFATASRTKDAQEGETNASPRFPEARPRKNGCTTKSKCASVYRAIIPTLLGAHRDASYLLHSASIQISRVFLAFDNNFNPLFRNLGFVTSSYAS